MAISTNYEFVADGLTLATADRVAINNTLVSESTFLGVNLQPSSTPIRKDGTLNIVMRLTLPIQEIHPNVAGELTIQAGTLG